MDGLLLFVLVKRRHEIEQKLKLHLLRVPMKSSEFFAVVEAGEGGPSQRKEIHD